jgi:hypothetical protein
MAWIVGCTEVKGGRIWVANKFDDIYYRDFITRMAR